MKNTIEYHLQTLGSVLLILGYFILLYKSVFWGCVFRLVANLLLIPYPLKQKYWNLVVLESFFLAIDGSKIIQLLYYS